MKMDKLFPFQLEGAKWLSERRVALLADEMGVGKSAQIIHAIDKIKAENILILCPAVARVNWAREFVLFSNVKRDPCVAIHKSHLAHPHAFVICSYDMATHPSLVRAWDCVILDECHYLKNVEALRTRAVYGNSGIVRGAKRVWALSGTPAPNHPGELWPILFTFGVTPLKYQEFIQRFCNGYKGPRGFCVTGAKKLNIPELRHLLSKVMLRRKKEHVLKQLPPIHFDHFHLEAGPVDVDVHFIQYVFPHDQKALLREKIKYEESLVNAVFTNVIHDKDRLTALEGIAKSVSTLRRYTGLQKVPEAIRMITKDLKNISTKKIVVFAIHQACIDDLRIGLKDYNPVTLYGGTPPWKRQRNIDKFQNDNNCRVFIGNIQACGTAITLTAAHHVYFLESEWTPALNSQAAMRCHRIGQEKPVFVKFFTLENSLDEKITRILKRKVEDLTEIFDFPQHKI